jgi:ATP-dependent DNA ligase
VKSKATFIEPMLLLRSDELPDGPQWLRELKIDGYRAVAIKSEGRIHLRSRNDDDFSTKYPGLPKRSRPSPTLIEGNAPKIRTRMGFVPKPSPDTAEYCVDLR